MTRKMSRVEMADLAVRIGTARGMVHGLIEAMNKLATEVLPQGFGWEWTELAYQQHGAEKILQAVEALPVCDPPETSLEPADAKEWDFASLKARGWRSMAGGRTL